MRNTTEPLIRSEVHLLNYTDMNHPHDHTRITHVTDLATIPIEVLVLSLYAFVSDSSLSPESPFQAWWFGGSVARWCPTLQQPLGPEPTRLLYPWDFPGKNTGVGCHFFLHFQAYLFSPAETLLKGQLGTQLPHKTFHQ